MQKKKKKSIGSRIFNIIVLIIFIFILYKLYSIYKVNYFNEFIRAERILYTSEFVRDEQIKYSEHNSYKIVSDEFNDAMFYKTIEVEKYTPYKVTCMVKTQDVVTENSPSRAGAQIAISDTVEHSISLTGTNDWQELSFMFNSKDRESVDISFRLGGYNDLVKGTVWFSDFKLEMGTKNEDTNWNVACFIFENTDVNVNINNTNQQVKVSMNSQDITKVNQNIERFKDACYELSNRQMTVTYDIIQIQEPITSVSFDPENLYYIDAANIQEIILPYLKQEIYDHIFAVVRFGDINKTVEIPVHDWVGLGGMDYLGIGFSNIRLQNDEHSYMYTYDSRINIFPEEVYLHEFLHTLERNLQEAGYVIPALHDYEQYGYEDEDLIGLRDWYKDYMQKNIKDNNTGNYVGLDSIVYKLKPVNETNFTYAMEIEFNEEPENFFEEIKGMIENIVNSLTISNKYMDERRTTT